MVPVVALVRPGFVLDPPHAEEVAAVFEVPLRFLMTPENHLRHSREWQGKARHILRHALWRAIYLGRDGGHDHEPLRPARMGTRAMKKRIASALRWRSRWLKDPALRRCSRTLKRGRRSACRRRGGAQCAPRRAGRRDRHCDDADAGSRDGESAGESAASACIRPGWTHGTVTLVADGQPFEVTTLRIDVETFGRKARVLSPTTGRRTQGGAISR